MKVSVLCVTAFALASGVQAATQGSLSGSSSSGSMVVTANGPSTPRQVQITGITDPVITNSTRSEYDAGNPGQTVTFCLVDTYSGNLTLAASTSGGLTSGGWALSSGTGYNVAFRVAFTKTDNTVINVLPPDSIGPPAFAIPSGVSVTDAALCGSGNVKTHLWLPNGSMPESQPARSYSATVTLTLTPQ